MARPIFRTLLHEETMVGFSLSGDLFNMFVFLELMTVSAIALTAHEIGVRQSIEGSLNFAVTNTIGSFLVLNGIALIYGRTGALNLAQIGETLGQNAPDRLVIVAFALLVAGFLVNTPSARPSALSRSRSLHSSGVAYRTDCRAG